VGYHPDGEIGAGHFIFGYPQAPGGRSHSPPVDPRRITDNGSLLVFRRLAQDVRVFREFCQAEATRIAEQWPEFNASRLAALMVGRWPSGVPTRRYQKTDPGGLSRDNDFDFLDDADGTHCPFGAHIRKVNPRKGQRDVVDVPRMLRRGIPFGPPYDEQPDTERGLIFLAYQTSISSQFEFLTKRWMNSNLNPGPGHDLLVGRSDGERSFTMKGPVEPAVVSDRGQQWINSTGGAYLFAPSRSGLAKFGTPSSQFGWWKAKQFWAITSDKVHELLFDQ
jgi:Dyp-type peroxidase family